MNCESFFYLNNRIAEASRRLHCVLQLPMYLRNCSASCHAHHATPNERDSQEAYLRIASRVTFFMTRTL